MNKGTLFVHELENGAEQALPNYALETAHKPNVLVTCRCRRQGRRHTPSHPVEPTWFGQPQAPRKQPKGSQTEWLHKKKTGHAKPTHA